MREGSSFWQWYARVNDDLRHQLIDRAWFGQHTRDNAFERDVGSMAEKFSDGVQPAQEPVVYTHNPHVPEALEGIGARGRDDANAENVKNVMQEFYGRNRGYQPPDEAAQMRERDQAIKDFYKTPDVEQER